MEQTPQAGEALEPDLAARERLTALYGSHGRAVLAYALRRAPTPEDAADVVAETFLVAWRRLGDVPEEPQARLWLYGVARRALLNQQRGTRRRERLAERLRVEARNTAAAAPAEERAERVLAGLARLRDDDRELLLLVAWEDLSPADAARVLEISPVAARTRLHRARRRLRAALHEGAPSGAPTTTQARLEEAG